jgi:IS30 family transposase
MPTAHIGREFGAHQRIGAARRADLYFADPYAAW